jgi:hypothetical protein
VNNAGEVSCAYRVASSGILHKHSGNGSAGQWGRTAIAHARRMRRRVATLTKADEASSEEQEEEDEEEEKQEYISFSESSGEEESEVETQQMTVTAQRREYLLATSGNRPDKDPFLSAWCASACMGVRVQDRTHIQRRLRAFLVYRQDLRVATNTPQDHMLSMVPRCSERIVHAFHAWSSGYRATI